MDKRAQILHYAMELVMRYGYSRVTMDDIARAAGMSRPALYQFFRNKADIYRAIAGDMHEQAMAAVKAALEGPEPTEQRIEKAIRVGLLDILAELEASQHGAELVDMGNELCGDIIDGWKRRKVEMLTGVYDDEARETPFAGEVLALQLVDWLEGMKCRVSDPEQRIAALRLFLAVQFAALAKSAQPA